METTEMTDALNSINTTPLLCRSKVKQTALEIAAAIRPANKFSRGGMSFVERIEAKVRAAIREEVRIHPSNPVSASPLLHNLPNQFLVLGLGNLGQAFL